MQAKAGDTVGIGTSKDGVRREGRQGGSPARCPWDGHPPVFLAPAVAPHPEFLAPAAAVHAPLLSVTEVVLFTGYSQTVGWDKARMFLHPPFWWSTAASFRK